MFLQFSIHYNTAWGQNLYVVGSLSGLGAHNIGQGAAMTYVPGGYWVLDIEIECSDRLEFSYEYLVRDDNSGITFREWGGPRHFSSHRSPPGKIVFKDAWRAQENPANILDKPVFTKILVGSDAEPVVPVESPSGTVHRFVVDTAGIPAKRDVCLTGSDAALGAWDEKNAVLLQHDGDSQRSVEVALSDPASPVYYKYGIYDRARGEITQWETGDNRMTDPCFETDSLTVRTDGRFRNPRGLWRGTGISIPVFSLRSSEGLGVGEFTDIRQMVDFARKAGLNVIQILPVNDTIASHTSKDSYPYAAISVFALHPLYMNLEAMNIPEELVSLEEVKQEKRRLNASQTVEYEAVMEIKSRYYKQAYDAVRDHFLEDPEYKEFFNKNREWLVPYAVFSCLRDRYKTADHSLWGEHSRLDVDAVHELAQGGDIDFDDIAVHYFIQYHLHRQLFESAEYARGHGIVLKGDLPIGVYRHSVSTWLYPELFDLDMQAGAPPDPFSDTGQNWGFPTYNWEAMADDDYQWWRERLGRMAVYFDAFRIDHILGFFRIWEIPREYDSGLMGHFKPALPYQRKELETAGLNFDEGRLCRSQGDHPDHDVLFLKTGDDEYQPRCRLQETASFADLDDRSKEIMDWLHNEFFYGRNEELWRSEALKHLPVIVAATEMLACGEDLGMVPDCVEGVMQELFISGLRIGRMPRHGDEEFCHIESSPYLSVCSTSTHDISTLRGWWEEDPEKTQRFYSTVLGGDGPAPEFCEPWICCDIIVQYLASPSMLAIFPLQDLLALDGNLRRENPHEERINQPADPDHFWGYRMHLSLEDLAGNESFVETLAGLVRESGRCGFEEEM